ncbi:MAG: hypothetical protein HOQ22_15750 [Nocardioidaceae bacterium]|nr:hypothetical protein [Nocardioidaceae bacterium]
MFDSVCTSCHRRQLIFPSQVRSLDNSERGILVTYTCWCGSEQTWLTGAAAPARDDLVPAA